MIGLIRSPSRRMSLALADSKVSSDERQLTKRRAERIADPALQLAINAHPPILSCDGLTHA